MSDAPQGPGWWQASDLRWYPPQDTGTPDGRGGRRWVLPTAVVLVVALLAGGAYWWGSTQTVDAATVAMEPVAADGPDPFTASVAIGELAEFPDTVNAVITTTTDELAADTSTGTLVATGDTPGLYGGTRDEQACDTTALEGFLTDPDNQSKATAWASVLGISTEDIPGYLRTLVPTVLTIDTRVTNHGFADGRATPRQSVLQAGSAVLVDDLGVPRVRCSCGNPLAEPDSLDLATATTNGAQWTGYSASRVVTPVAAPEPQTDLTLLDTTNGDTYQQPVGTTPTTWIATTGIEGTDTTNPGSILLSEDGVDWEQVHTTEVDLRGVAHGDGTYVAVGSAPDAGLIYTSTDGRTWSEPIASPIPLYDVAHGNGTWVAIGNGAFDGGLPVLLSDDGTTWIEAPRAPVESLGVGHTLTFSDGSFKILGLSCGNGRNSPGCEPWDLLESADGTSWQPAAADPLGQVGFIGEAIVLGADRDDTAILGNDGSSRLDGSTWRSAGGAPGFWPRSLVGHEGLWIAAATGNVDGTEGGVWTSPDLATWTRISTIDSVSDVAVNGSAVAAPTTTVPATPAGVVIGVDALEFVDDGGEVSESLPYDGAPAAFIGRLQEHFGREPVMSSEEFVSLGSVFTTATWDGLSVTYEGTDPSAPNDYFEVSLDTPTEDISGADGLELGWTRDQVLDAFPESVSSEELAPGGWGPGAERLMLSQFGDPGGARGGLVVVLQDSTVTSIRAPSFYLPVN